MKKLAMFLGCSLVAFAIGCGDGGDKKSTGTPPVAPSGTDMMDPKMKAAMDKPAEVTPAADPAATTEDKKDPPADDKKDPPADDKKDAPADDKKDAPADDKKE
ncbi:MAG: hypothetical protein ACKV2Q_18790 [Planctomycetaceae bacterium]